MAQKKKDSFVGVWVSIDEPYTSTVHFTVKKDRQKYTVTALDADDGEKAEVYDVQWDGKSGVLRFSCYWESSGRFTKCKFMQTDEDKISMTFTYTDHDVLVRKKRLAR